MFWKERANFFSTSSLAAVLPAVSAKFVLEYNLRKSSIWKMSNVAVKCSNHNVNSMGSGPI